MTVPSGLGSSFGLAEETTVGTFTPPARWILINKESINTKHTVATSSAVGAGPVHLASRRVVTGIDVTGNVDLELTDAGGLGVLFKHALGSTPVVSSPTAGVTQQVHQLGDATGLGLSVQVGRPTVTSTMQSFSYSGVKITDITLAAQVGQAATLALGLDGINADTTPTYVAPSYPSNTGYPLNFASGSLTTGGTVGTSGGVVSVTGGTAFTGAVKSVEIKLADPLAVNRRTIGSLNKREQLRNGFVAISGSVDVEFSDLNSYNLFKNNTSFALDLKFTGPNIGATSTASALQITLPACFFDETPINVGGPDIITSKMTFTALAPTSGVTPIQIVITSADTAV